MRGVEIKEGRCRRGASLKWNAGKKEGRGRWGGVSWRCDVGMKETGCDLRDDERFRDEERLSLEYGVELTLSLETEYFR